MTLHNFRCYRDLDITFHPRLTVLVAANGEGKTTILDALRIAFWPFVSQFDLASSAYSEPANTIQIDDVRSIRLSDDAALNSARGIVGEMARQLPCSVSVNCEFENKPMKWTRLRKKESKRSKTLDGSGCSDLTRLAKDAQIMVRDLSDSPIDLPLFGYYGTGRLWQHKRLTQFRKNQTNKQSQKVRTFAYRDCLDPASSFRQFEEWFIDFYKSARAQQIQALEKGEDGRFDQTPYFTLIRVIQKAINTVLAPLGWHDLEFSQMHDESLVLKNAQKEVFKVAQLSDGIKNMLGLVADIAYRCVLLNAHLQANAATQTRGIIMIDEVDMHLHPSWQQTVVGSLIEAFPNVQFVLTTHSPQVLTTVPSDSIRMLEKGFAHDAPPGSKGAESSRLLQRIFGVESRPLQDENTKLLLDYEQLVYADKWPETEALQKRTQLNNIFMGSEPKLTELDLYIENRQWEMDFEKD